jgi:leucine dehydrogenase
MKDIALENLIKELATEVEHEKIVAWSNPKVNYRGVIAIHSTKLGPAVGGTRFFNYTTDRQAVVDAIRLSRAMSYKSALAGLPLGGGKAVIMGDPQNANREEIFREHGRFVNSLEGQYITAEDVGTRPSDMVIVQQETKFVGGLPGRSGDPSPVTSLGVFRAMQACAKHHWGKDDLMGRTIAIQGCGSTGYHLATSLHDAGAKLVVADVDSNRAERFADEFGATISTPNGIFDVAADVFAPCALGGVINDGTVDRLKVQIVAGSANNLLLDDSHGDILHVRGITYAPDCIANSGGIINGCRELLGWSEERARERVDGLYNKMLAILDDSVKQGKAPFRIAYEKAREILK